MYVGCREVERCPSEWVRDLITRELRTSSQPTRILAEVLGVRLLLVNVLRPLAAGQKLSAEAFDKLLDDIGSTKYELATKLVAEKRRYAMPKTAWGRKETIIWPRHMPIYTTRRPSESRC